MSMLPTNKQKRNTSGFRNFFVVGIAFLVVLVVAAVFFAFAQVSKKAQTPVLTNFSMSKGMPSQKLTIIPTRNEVNEITSFSFTAAGDYGQTSHTDANLNYIAKAGVKFNLAIGDLNYDPTHVSADAYSAYIKSHLPANFPFEIIAGDHDTEAIDTYATDNFTIHS